MKLTQKQIGAILLCGGLVLTSIVIEDTAEGSSRCKHAGDTQTISGKSQICKKMSGKLVWVNTSKPIVNAKPSIVITKTWVDYIACLESYKSSPLGASWASTFCDKYDPHRGKPLKSWAEYTACQQYAQENPTFGMFEDCSAWHP